MNNFWINLRPLEKRLVVGAGVVVFLILNAWFVVPHFSDMGRVNSRRGNALKTIDLFQAKIQQVPTYERFIKGLESEGLAVPQEDQAMHFSTTIQSQAAQT